MSPWPRRRADRSDRVRAAMAAAPRIGFLPADQLPWAHLDRALPIGFGATNSQPTTVRTMLELLDVRPGHRVLDVGSGSGWTAAILDELTAPDGRVAAVELEADLVARSAHALRDRDRVEVHQADPHVLGLPEHAPYDRILVSAAARELPEALCDQLADGGRMVAPVRDRLIVVTRRGGELDAQPAPGHYAFVPLR